MRKAGEYALRAERRTALGSRACRRLRAQGLIPANLYGHGKPNAYLTVSRKEFLGLFEAGHRMLTLLYDGEQEVGLIREIQYDPVTDRVIHVDFTRVFLEEVVDVAVPVHTHGVPKGVQGGGVLEHVVKEVRVRGPASEIPEEIVLQIAELESGGEIRIRDLVLPERCQVVGEEPEDVVLHILLPRAEAVLPEGEVEAAPEEPEVIGKRAEESEEEERGKKGGKGA